MTMTFIKNESNIISTLDKDEFKQAIDIGLSKPIKQIPSKFFYDSRGSDLFDQITHNPEYYLTNCEINILKANSRKLSKLINENALNLIELGPGDGSKSKIILNSFSENHSNLTYIPIDISTEYVNKIIDKHNDDFRNIDIIPINADFFDGLKKITLHSDKRNMVLFLGSSIGNFDRPDVNNFLKNLNFLLNHGDYVLLGFDLRKDISILMRAYNDSQGITRQFNLNLLERINRELGGHFDVKQFEHYETYNVYNGAMESYIVSLSDQFVDISALKKVFHFDQSEPIHVEYSFKYLLSEIHNLAQDAHFDVVEEFFDYNHYFVDSFWRKID